MKILWITNCPLNEYMKVAHGSLNINAGWLDGVRNAIILSDEKKEIELSFCSLDVTENDITIDGSRYFSFKKNDYSRLESIIDQVKPDLVHIFGTEYRHTLMATKILISRNIPFVTLIQGLISVCAKYYTFGLPKYIFPSLRDIVRRDSIAAQAEKFKQRGKFEITALEKTKNVIGFTDWDNVCTSLINPNRRYFRSNLVLRPEFYDGSKWSLKKCERHTIFISQISYPIKGFHTFIEAIGYLKNDYPDLKVYVTGQDIVHPKNAKEALRQSSYANYLKHLIVSHGLDDNIKFLGQLDAGAMKAQFFKSHIAVCCSVMENSSNSIFEAGILGVPTVATMVGGNTDMIIHGKTGYLYNILEPYMAYYYIRSIFEDDALSDKLSAESIKYNEQKCSPQLNGKALVAIYKRVISDQGLMR